MNELRRGVSRIIGDITCFSTTTGTLSATTADVIAKPIPLTNPTYMHLPEPTRYADTLTSSGYSRRADRLQERPATLALGTWFPHTCQPGARLRANNSTFRRPG